MGKTWIDLILESMCVKVIVQLILTWVVDAGDSVRCQVQAFVTVADDAVFDIIAFPTLTVAAVLHRTYDHLAIPLHACKYTHTHADGERDSDCLPSQTPLTKPDRTRARSSEERQNVGPEVCICWMQPPTWTCSFYLHTDHFVSHDTLLRRVIVQKLQHEKATVEYCFHFSVFPLSPLV